MRAVSGKLGGLCHVSDFKLFYSAGCKIIHSDAESSDATCAHARNGATVADWLQGLGLQEYSQGFEKAGMDVMESLLARADTVSEQDLTAAGVTKPGHQKKIMFYLSKRAKREKLSDSETPTTGDVAEEQQHEEDDEDEDKDGEC